MLSFPRRTLAPTDCPVTYCVDRVGGKWKPVLLHLIRKGVNRFGVLQRGITGISKQSLVQQLRELEADGILERRIFAENIPRVEYHFTEFGQSLFPVLDAMSRWGLEHMEGAVHDSSGSMGQDPAVDRQ